MLRKKLLNQEKRKRKKVRSFKSPYIMLLLIGIILAVLWLIGLLTHFVLGGFIHILLAIAIIVILVRIIRGRNPI